MEMSIYDRVGGRKDGFGIDIFRAQNDAKNLATNGAKRIGFKTTISKLPLYEWIDPYLGLFTKLDHPEDGFAHINDLDGLYIAIEEQWVIE